MRSYETARGLFSFLGFCAGALIILGAIVALMGGSATQSLGRNAGAIQFIIGAMPGIMIAAVGVIGQTMVQMGRASVDTAEYSQQSLQVSRQHMELTQQLLEQSKTAAASFASLKMQRPESVSGPTPAEADQGASYANQPPQTVTAEKANNAPAAIPAATASSTKAITHEEQIPLTPISHDITYKDGKFVVGDKRFWSKSEALEYQETLIFVPPK